MALKDSARVKELTTTSGTGTLTLLGAATLQHKTIAESNIGVGNSFYYYLLDADGINWERGLATCLTTTTCSRDEVYESTNSNNAIDLSVCEPGTAHVIFNAFVPGKATGDLDFDGLNLIGANEKNTSLNVFNLGTTLNGTTTVNLNYQNGSTQTGTVEGGTLTFVFSNWPEAGKHGILNLWLTNAGLATINLPTAQYKLFDDTYTTDIEAYLIDRGGAASFPNDALIKLRYETIDGGATVYGAWS